MPGAISSILIKYLNINSGSSTKSVIYMDVAYSGFAWSKNLSGFSLLILTKIFHFSLLVFHLKNPLSAIRSYMPKIPPLKLD